MNALDGRPHFSRRAIRGNDPDPDLTPLVEQYVLDGDSLVNLHAVGAGMVEQYAIKLSALDLPGPRAFTGNGFRKTDVSRFLIRFMRSPSPSFMCEPHRSTG